MAAAVLWSEGVHPRQGGAHRGRHRLLIGILGVPFQVRRRASPSHRPALLGWRPLVRQEWRRLQRLRMVLAAKRQETRPFRRERPAAHRSVLI